MSDLQSLPPTRAMIGRWGVDRYVGLLRRWSLLAAGVAVLLVFSKQSRSIAIGWEVLVTIAVGWLVTKRDGGKIESLAAGAFVGVSLGLATSVSRYIMNPTLANGLLILIETALTTVIASLMTVTTVLLLHLIHQPKN